MTSHDTEMKAPTRLDNAVFAFKANMFRLRRMADDLRHPINQWRTLSEFTPIRLASESTSSLWDISAPPAEKILQAGKVHNLRLACARIDQCYIPTNGIFSFWRQVGRPTKWSGYARGRELRQGCIIPSVGGGLCQVSNALYDAALKANCTILERHAHTQVIPGSFAELGRDATIFWNYVDLRFRWSKPLGIKTILTSDQLIVQFWEMHDA